MTLGPNDGGRTDGVAGFMAITFDFGNTLVPVGRDQTAAALRLTGQRIGERCGPFTEKQFLDVWAAERDRQFAEELPLGREVDMARRVVRVLARLRGVAAPGPDEPWDDVAAATYSQIEEIEWALEVYVDSWVEAIPAPRFVGPLLERLSRRYLLGVISNWPLAVSIERYLDAAGWSGYLTAVVVSQTSGSIKPARAIFDHAQGLLDVPCHDILHVGDDWAADIVGAKQAGYRAAYLRERPADSPLPSSERDDSVRADLEIAHLRELEAVLAAGAGTVA